MSITIPHPIQNPPPVDGFVQRIYSGFMSRTGGQAERAIPATGDITSIAAASLVDGETFTLDDGSNAPTVFEFDVSANGVGAGNIPILAVGTAAAVRDLTITAINSVATLGITATPSGTENITLTNDVYGDAGNTSSSETVTNAGFILTDMTGGYDSFTVNAETLEFTADYTWDNPSVPNPESVRIVPQFRFSAALHHCGRSLIEDGPGLLTRRAIRFY